MSGAFWRRLWRDRAGASAIEYALIVALIAAAVFASVGSLGDAAAALYDRVTAIRF